VTVPKDGGLVAITLPAERSTFAFLGFGEFEWRHSRFLKLVTPLKNPGFLIRRILHSVLEVFAKYHLAWHRRSQEI
jgi:hypothetical protein